MITKDTYELYDPLVEAEHKIALLEDCLERMKIDLKHERTLKNEYMQSYKRLIHKRRMQK